MNTHKKKRLNNGMRKICEHTSCDLMDSTHGCDER
jgi:hypothetical protein